MNDWRVDCCFWDCIDGNGMAGKDGWMKDAKTCNWVEVLSVFIAGSAIVLSIIFPCILDSILGLVNVSVKL